jgi:molybdate transport system substrate-binding protein
VNTIHINRRQACAVAIFAVLFSGSAAHAQPRQEIVVAAAANLTDAFQKVAAQFETETGIHVTLSFAATAQLTQQAENGAPFDVIAVADTEHIDELEKNNLLTAGSRAVYTRGVLALWIPPTSKARVNSIKDLTSEQVKVIAVAKPELAPYGEAAVAALKKAGVWDRVQPKIVYAENINMARQYGVSGNADAVLTAYALVLREKGMVTQVDASLYPPIDQALGVLAKSHHQAEAKRFAEFILHGDGQKILADYGYRQP